MSSIFSIFKYLSSLKLLTYGLLFFIFQNYSFILHICFLRAKILWKPITSLIFYVSLYRAFLTKNLLLIEKLNLEILIFDSICLSIMLFSLFHPRVVFQKLIRKIWLPKTIYHIFLNNSFFREFEEPYNKEFLHATLT